MIVITGPTAIGKSRLALHWARRLQTEIISADSRQVYRGMPIATAAPTPEEMSEVRHHLVGFKEVTDYYSASLFEEDALSAAADVWTRSPYAIACGGSMLYVDTLCHGIDPLPTVDPRLRLAVMTMMRRHGDDWARRRLEQLDPTTAARLHPSNLKRIVHALEVSLQGGRPYSEMLTGQRRERPFRVIKVLLTAPREVIYDRINRRVTEMAKAGLVDEARSLYPAYCAARRALAEAGADTAAPAVLNTINALNTVGLKELFAHFDGEMTLPEALDKIRRNTRVYAKKQLTWYQRDPDAVVIDTSLTDPFAPETLDRLLK